MDRSQDPIEEGRTDSYRMEQLDAEAEVARLEAQVRLVRPLEDDFLSAAGLAEDAWLLDVGCGPAFFAERAARELVPQGRVTGVDVDSSLLDRARRRIGDSAPNLELLAGTGVRLPIDDAQVDFAYARFLLQHLTEPGVVLRDMRRVTRPGGVVGLVDTDDGSLIVHPAPDGFDELVEAASQARRARGGDRHVGRKLRSLLIEAGRVGVHVRVYPFTSESVGAVDFLRVTTGFKAGVLGPPWITPERLAQITQGLSEAIAEPGFFGQAMGYAAWGTAP